jgi:hypothetical protein
LGGLGIEGECGMVLELDGVVKLFEPCLLQNIFLVGKEGE